MATEVLVPVDSAHPAHADMFKTLNLLRLTTLDETIYFIVEGCRKFGDLDSQYFYEEHTCPTNFIRIEAIFTPDDDDPHGLFEYVKSVWMTQEYLTACESGQEDDYLREVFPETRITDHTAHRTSGCSAQ